MSNNPYSTLHDQQPRPPATNPDHVISIPIQQPPQQPPQQPVYYPPQPVVAQPMYPQLMQPPPPLVYVGGANPGLQLLMSMPVHIATSFKVIYVLLFILLIGVCVTDWMLIDGYWYTIGWWYVIVMLLVPVLIWYKTPTRCDVTMAGVTVYTRGTSYMLSYDRMASVEIVRSMCCWTGAACSLPRTKFTTWSNGVFFRSIDCATSLCFSPVDLNQFLLALQRTPANNKILYS